MNELDTDTLNLVRAKIVELETTKKNKGSNPINTPFARAGPTEGVLWRVPPWNLGNPYSLWKLYLSR